MLAAVHRPVSDRDDQLPAGARAAVCVRAPCPRGPGGQCRGWHGDCRGAAAVPGLPRPRPGRVHSPPARLPQDRGHALHPHQGKKNSQESQFFFFFFFFFLLFTKNQNI